MPWLQIAFVAAGLALAAWAWRRHRGACGPLGPPPQGALPDPWIALVVAVPVWFGATGLAVQALHDLGAYDVVRAAAAVTFVHFTLALALLAPALRGTIRPRLTATGLVRVGAAAGLVVFAAAWVVTFSIERAYAVAREPLPQQTIVEVFLRTGAAERTGLAIVAVVLAPFSEEVFFRGVLLPVLARWMPVRTALLAQALLFGAVHVESQRTAPLAIPLALVGWCAGWAYLRTGSLAVPIVLHAVFNAVNVLAMVTLV
jgi:membrane protease YdiL (CAAX protease family)